MQVRHILAIKERRRGRRAPTATLAEAAALLNEKRIGALFRAGRRRGRGRHLFRIDVVRALAADGAEALTNEVDRYLTRDVVTCGLGRYGGRADGHDDQGPLPPCPVLDEDGKLCGLVSIGDVVKNRIAETVREAEELRVYISATA